VSANATQFPAESEQPLGGKPRTLWRDAWARLRKRRLALICAGILGIYFVIATVGFTGALGDAMAAQVGQSNEPPSFTNPRTGKVDVACWFGTDFLGRSVFWRLMYGVRVALTVALLASLIEIVIGVTLGAVAGFFGGWIDALIVWLFSTMASVPWILLMIAFAYALREQSVFGYELAGIPTIVLALGLTTWVGLCRLVRGEVLKHRARDYVTAARAAGAGQSRIIFRHILPNVFHIVIINFTLGLAGFVHAEVILSFLGLGVTDVPSWGRMIDDAKLELLKGVWWQLAVASGAIFVFSLAVNILGDALRDALDPRLRGVD
jgi:peptide/nickel transport system permease protein